MKKQLLTSLLSLCIASGALANSFNFSDADYFGTIHTTGGISPPNGSPNGVTLTFGGASASVTSSFDLINPDATSSFTIGGPYAPSVQGTRTTVLGFIPGTHLTDFGIVTLFLRDPGAGAETLTYTASTQTINSLAFTTQLVISQSITAAVTGLIDSNGFFNYTVRATSGSFILDAAYLEVGASTVPDGGSTVAFLGSILMIGAAFRRKFGMA